MKLKVLERFNLLFKVKLWPKFYKIKKEMTKKSAEIMAEFD